MQRRVTVAVALSIFIAAAIGSPSSSIAAQSGGDGRGVTYELVVGGEASPGMGTELRLYWATFEPGAGLPLNVYPEAMVTAVEEGSLALVAGPDLQVGAIVATSADGGPILLADGVECASPCVAMPDQTLMLPSGSAVFHAADSQYAYQSAGDRACVLNSVITAVGTDFSWGWLGRAAAAPASPRLAVASNVQAVYAKRSHLIPICARKV